MNKKLILPVLASIFLIPSVLAAVNLDPLTDALSTFVKFFLVSIPGSLGPIYFMKFLLWILFFTMFFAILHYLGGKTPFGRKNIAIVISFALSTMIIFVMPASWVFLIGQEYGFVSAFLLLAVPVIAVFFLNTRLFRTDAETPAQRAFGHGGRALVYYFLSVLIENYNTAIIKEAKTNPTGFAEVYNIAIAICLLLFFYHLIMTIASAVGGTGNAEGTGPAAGGTGFPALNVLPPLPPGQQQPGQQPQPPPQPPANYQNVVNAVNGLWDSVKEFQTQIGLASDAVNDYHANANDAHAQARALNTFHEAIKEINDLQMAITTQQRAIQGNVNALQYYNQNNPEILKVIIMTYVDANRRLVDVINNI